MRAIAVGPKPGAAVGLAVSAIRAHVERMATKLGCKVAPPSSDGGTSSSDKGKAPTEAVCEPKTIRIEVYSDLGGKLGEYNAVFNGIVKTYSNSPYYYKCIWVSEGTNAEAFVALLLPAGSAIRPICLDSMLDIQASFLMML